MDGGVDAIGIHFAQRDSGLGDGAAAFIVDGAVELSDGDLRGGGINASQTKSREPELPRE